MKTTLMKYLLCGLMSLAAFSCTGYYEHYNSNPSEATEDAMNQDGKRLAVAMSGMQNNIIPAQEHLYQFVEILTGATYGGYLADSRPWENTFAMYNPTQDWLNKPMEVIVAVYKNYYNLKALTKDPVILAIADVTRVSAMSRVTDIYGPIPYTHMQKDGQLNNPYDSQQKVYEVMLTELDESIEVLTANRTALISANLDRIYSGNLERWIRFANSLKLRLAMHLAYVDATLAQTKAEEAVAHIVGVIESNSDNALLPVATHPLTIVVGEWGDSRVAADIASYMNGYGDPRRSQYFTVSTFGADTKITNGYHGLRVGIQPSSKEVAMQYSSVNMASVTKDGILILNAAEVAFLRAEGALRGWNMGGDAETYYKRGVQLSFEQWGAGNASTYLANATAMPESYVDPIGAYSFSGRSSQITVAWNGTDNFETNLERIITQKWIANFPLGIEAWTDFRRTGYPHLMKSPSNRSNGIVDDNLRARRPPYPQLEYSNNAANMQEAVQLLGGLDNMATNLWWNK